MELDLHECGITDIGAKALAGAIKHNTSIKVLWVYKNEIGDFGAQAIANALKENKSVANLYVFLLRFRFFSCSLSLSLSPISFLFPIPDVSRSRVYTCPRSVCILNS